MKNQSITFKNNTSKAEHPIYGMSLSNYPVFKLMIWTKYFKLYMAFISCVVLKEPYMVKICWGISLIALIEFFPDRLQETQGIVYGYPACGP